MALIGNIRKRSGLLVIVVGVALAAFVLGDLTGIFSGPGRRGFNIGVVEGEEIPILAFNQRLEDNLNMRRQNLGRDNLSAQEQFSVRQSTWDEMVNEIINNRQYKFLGLNVSTEELDDLVRGPNPHNFISQSFTDPQTGEFDPASVDNFLRNFSQVDPAMRQRYLYIEQAVKNDHLTTKYRNLLSQGHFVPRVIAEKDHASKNRMIEARAVALRYQIIPDDEVVVSEQELRRFYDNNKFRFTQEESRAIDYIIFEVQPSEEDRRLINEEVARLYEEFIHVQDVPLFVNAVSDTRFNDNWLKRGELPLRIEEALFDASPGTMKEPFVDGNRYFMARLLDAAARPDSMRASHILVTYRGTGVNPDVTRTKEEAQRKADSLFNEINRNRRKFNEFALTMSDDMTAAQSMGDLGWFEDGMMVTPFNQAVLDNRVGQIVQVETQFGFHIVEITGKTEPIRKVKVAVVERAIEPGTRTIQEVYVNASQFASTNRTAAQFNQAADEMGLSRRTADNVRRMDNILPGVTFPREIIRWTYGRNVKPGDVSPAFDVDGMFVVATLKSIKEEGTMPFEQARSLIEPLVRREKKAEILKKRFNDVFTPGMDINTLASKLETNVETLNLVTLNSVSLPVFGRDPIAIGKLTTLEEGQMSDPIAGEVAVYVFKVDEVKFTEFTDQDVIDLRRVLGNSFRSRVTREAFNAVKKHADIEDNRMLFF